MPKKLGVVLVIIGALLILSAASLLLYNLYEDARAGQEAESLLAGVMNNIQDEENTPSGPLDPELPVKEIDGYDYVGYLTIPDLELELPVMSEWDYERLKIAPCRHFGSSRTDDLVIAAHNYKRHFGYLYQLEIGNTIIFTDMDGIENIYEITKMATLAANDVETVQNSGHDLVLYTCTYSGQARVAAFCDRKDKSTAPQLIDSALETETKAE